MKVIRRCSICKSEDLEYMAAVKWNRHTQKFEVIDIDNDYPYCLTCEDNVNDEVIRIVECMKVI